MKKFLYAIGGIFVAAVLAVLVWTCLYLSIPNVKDGTDKLFKWNDYATEQPAEPETEASMSIFKDFDIR